MIGGAALDGKGGFNIGMGDMPIARCIEIQRLDSAARLVDGDGAGLLVHRDHLAAPTVNTARFALVAGKPDAVACFQVQWLRRERPLDRQRTSTKPSN